jgi:hypothetical protein
MSRRHQLDKHNESVRKACAICAVIEAGRIRVDRPRHCRGVGSCLGRRRRRRSLPSSQAAATIKIYHSEDNSTATGETGRRRQRTARVWTSTDSVPTINLWIFNLNQRLFLWVAISLDGMHLLPQVGRAGGGGFEKVVFCPAASPGGDWRSASGGTGWGRGTTDSPHKVQVQRPYCHRFFARYRGRSGWWAVSVSRPRSRRVVAIAQWIGWTW